MSLYLYPVVCGNISEVNKFCIEDLAGIFYRCLKHEEPRAEIDWITAERWTNKKLRVFDFTEKYLILSVYENLRKMDNSLSEINSDHFGKINSEELFKVKDYLSSKITKERFESIIYCLDSNKRRDYKKIFLGRDVWDELYGPFREMLEDTEVLNGSKYEKILFF